MVTVTACGYGLEDTPLGPAQRYRIERLDGADMSWDAVWAAFAEAHPGKYAIQLFPPQRSKLSNASKYHLWVLEEAGPVRCFDLVERDRR